MFRLPLALEVPREQVGDDRHRLEVLVARLHPRLHEPRCRQDRAELAARAHVAAVAVLGVLVLARRGDHRRRFRREDEAVPVGRDDADHAARFQHPEALACRAHRIAQVLEQRVREDGIEARIRERQFVHARFAEAQVGHPRGACALRAEGDLRRIHVDADHRPRCNSPCDALRDAAGTTRAVEHGHPGLEMRDEEGTVREERAAHEELHRGLVPAERVVLFVQDRSIRVAAGHGARAAVPAGFDIDAIRRGNARSRSRAKAPHD